MLVHGRQVTLCDECRYDLSGLSASDRCPECGREITKVDIDPAKADLATMSIVFGIAGWATMGCMHGFSPVILTVGFVAGVLPLLDQRLSRRVRRRARIGVAINGLAAIVLTCVWLFVLGGLP